MARDERNPLETETFNPIDRIANINCPLNMIIKHYNTQYYEQLIGFSDN